MRTNVSEDKVATGSYTIGRTSGIVTPSAGSQAQLALLIPPIIGLIVLARSITQIARHADLRARPTSAQDCVQQLASELLAAYAIAGIPLAD